MRASETEVLASRHPFSVLPDEKGSDNNLVKRRKNGKNHVQLFKTFLFMKTNKFWFVMAAAAMLAGTTMMTSCEKEEEISKREVIESEVLDEGVAEKVTEEVGTEGTQLSYESWIVVRGQTRAAFQNKVSVTLFNRFNHVIDEVEVENFDFGQPEVGISYQTSDSRKEQDYVTVVDSVLVYSLKYENGFVLEYELMYEVPTYDDGVTEKEMPYIRYGAIVDNGMTVTGMDNLTENGQTWLRKLVRHSISVVFNDKSYTIEASIVAKSLEKAGDVLLASKKVNEGVEPVSVDAAKASGTYKSWIEVEQTWSESGTKTFKKEALLKHYVLFPQEIFRFDAGEKYAVLDDISLEISTDPQIREEGTAVDGVAIDVYKEDQRVEMRKNDDENLAFTTLTTAVFERARYVDDKLSCDFPVPAVYSDFAASYDLIHGWQETVNDDGFPCWQAEYEFRFAIKYGNNVYSSELPWFLEYRERE